MTTPARLARVRNFIFDLDGCVWYGRRPAPGARVLLRRLRDAGYGVFFLTNASGATVQTLVRRLHRAGVVAPRGSILGPLAVIGRHPLLRRRPPALVIGTAALKATLRAAGVPVVADPRRARVVVVGRDPRMRYTDLARAVQALDRGARLLAVNADTRVPVDGGVVPGAGAIVAALVAVTGVEPAVVGKPSPFFFRAALDAFGIAARDTAMVGDSVQADVAGGKAAGLVTVLVGDLPRRPSDIKPDLVVRDLGELRRALGLG